MPARHPRSPSGRRLTRLISVALAGSLALAACGDSTGPTPTVAGTWEGDFIGGTLHVLMTQQKGAVSGNGSVRVNGDAIPITVTGTFANPDLEVTVESDCCEPFTYSARLEDRRTLSGEMHGSGFTGEELVLFKQ